MVRLGLQLSLNSGREALARLVVTTLAVAIGVTILVSLAAEYHAFETTSHRSSWELTQGPDPSAPPATKELWNYSESLYHGKFIEDLSVAGLTADAPVPPGIPKLPGPGQFYASPALAALLRTVPAAELGARFPGTMIGIIGDRALTGPTELVAMGGYLPAQLRALPNTFTIDQINTSPQTQGTTNIYRLLFGLGAIAMLFPLLILINTATRLAAARREQRYAAFRLFGATPRQTAILASVDAVVGAAFGSILGIGGFLAVRPLLENITVSGARFFPVFVTPTAMGYLAVLAGVPVAAAIASLVSLRRVQATPLGVSRKVTPPPPRAWRLLPLAAGITLFVIVASSTVAGRTTNNSSLQLAFLGLIVTMIGLVLSGSWLTMQAARLLGKLARGPSALLASRRLADNPKGGFRAVSGLVLAVFVGTAIASLVPSVVHAQTKAGEGDLTDVLRVPYFGLGGPGGGLTPKQGATLIHQLDSYHGVTVVPIYVNPAFMAAVEAGPQSVVPNGLDAGPLDDSVMRCSDLAVVPSIGTCAAGAKAVTLTTQELMGTDNPLSIARDLPFVTTRNPTASSSVSALTIGGLLVKTPNAATLEAVRTYLTLYNQTIISLGGGSQLDAWQQGSVEPETFGEMALVRNNDEKNAEHVILAALFLTLLVASCSLAVTLGGSVIERRRPFTLLRLTGTSVQALYRVVFIESVLPLLTASVVAAVVGGALAIPLVGVLFPKAATPLPGGLYYAALGGGLVLSVAIILSVLPLLSRTTSPDLARFE